MENMAKAIAELSEESKKISFIKIIYVHLVELCDAI